MDASAKARAPVALPVDGGDAPAPMLVPVTGPVAATLVGVMAPRAKVMAGVVVAVATVPLTPLAEVTETLVTVPLPPPETVQVEPRTQTVPFTVVEGVARFALGIFTGSMVTVRPQ